jgi:hypothetical protein
MARQGPSAERLNYLATNFHFFAASEIWLSIHSANI